MRAILGKTLRWALGVAGVCVLTVALLLGVLRVLLPLAPAFQEEIAQWTSESLGYPVEFARIQPSWGLTGPEFRLRGVRVMSERGGRPLLLADEILVGLNLWRLFPGRGLTLDRMFIAGASLTLERLGPGSFSVQGRDPAYYPGGPARLLAFVPANIQVQDVWVEYVDLAHGVRENLWLERLSAKIAGGRIALDGRVVLPEKYGDWLGVGADIDLGQWSRALAPSGPWRLHLEGRAVHLDRLRELAPEASALPVVGSGDFNVFADLVDTGIQQFFGELDFSGLRISGGPADHVFDRLAGHFEWQRQGREYSLSAARIKVLRGGSAWPDTALSARWSLDEDGKLDGVRLESDFVRLEDVLPPLPGLAPGAGLAASLRPRGGDVTDLAVEWEQARGALPEIRADFSGLDLEWGDSSLRLAGLDGRLRHEAGEGNANIVLAGESRFHAPWLDEPALLEELRAQLNWRKRRESWSLEGSNLRVAAAGMDWAGRFSLDLPSDGGSPVLDLSGGGERIDDVPAAIRRLPWKNTPGLPFGWLGKALHSGRGEDWNVLLSGPLRSFPFGGGVLRVEMGLRDAVMTLYPDWPDGRNMAGRIVLNGPALAILGGEGELAGVRWRDVRVTVADLSRPVVEVSATSDDPLPRLLEGLGRTPVADRIHGALLKAETSGPASTRFDFRLPIADRSDWWMRSEIVLDGADLRLNELMPPVRGLRGTIDVTRDGVLADDLRGRFLDESLAVRVGKALPGMEGYGYRLELEGATSAGALQELFDCCALERLSGEFAWRGEVLAPSASADPVRPVRVRLETDLLGLASAFPHPVGKSPDTPGPTWLEFRWGWDQPPRLTGRLGLGLGLGPGIAMEFVEGEKGWRVGRGRFHFGDTLPQLPPAAELRVDGNLDWLRPGEWARLLAGAAGALGLPWELDLEVGSLYALSSELKEQRIRVLPRSDGWQAEFRGEAADGRVFWPRPNPGKEGAQLLADLNWLRLRLPDPQPPGPADPRSLPPGKLLVDELEVGKMRLGEVRARYGKTAGGLGVNWFRTRSPSLSSQGSAAWLVADAQGTQHLGRLDMVLESTDVASALEQLGYARGLSGDRGAMTLSVSWEGPPTGDFLARANGSVGIEVESGEVPALDPGGGRVLGVLSIARLPRKLALDFREMTEEGLPFDRLAGDFSLRSGQAYTCNMGLQGAVAGLALFGRTGLQDRSYDQVAVVSPNLPDLLSLGGVIIGGTGLGATMLLLSQAFREPLQAISANYYRVSGFWDDPLVKRVMREEIDLRAFADCGRYLEENLTRMPDVDWNALLSQVEEETLPTPAPPPTAPGTDSIDGYPGFGEQADSASSAP